MRDDELKIWLVKRSNGIWAIRYNDPETKRFRQKSTGKKKKKEADRLLGELRADLLNNRFQPTNKISWSDFRRRYEDEYLPSLAHKTAHKIATVFNKIEEILCPQQLQDLTSDRLSYFQSKLRDGSRTESTIAGYIAHLRAALNWAVGLGLLFKLPKITKPNRAKSGKMMKGRPITPEEFQTILDQVPSTVGENSASSWIHLLNGLWWSGLRLSESLELYWDDDRKLCVTFEGDDLMLKIPSELE